MFIEENFHLENLWPVVYGIEIYTLVRHLNWGICYQYADAAQVGQFATIDDLIGDFRLNYAVVDSNK